MKVLSGDDCGFLKLVDAETKTVTLNATQHAKLFKPSRKLAIKGICYADTQQERIAVVRDFGALEIYQWKEVDTEQSRPLAIAIPPQPINVHLLADDKLLVVCRTGEIIKFNVSRLLDLEKEKWPQSTVGHLADIKHGEIFDWRLRLNPSFWDTVDKKELITNRKIIKAEIKREIKTANVMETPLKKKYAKFHWNRFVDFVYKAQSQPLSCSAVFRAGGKQVLLLGGDKMNLVASHIEEFALDPFFKPQVGTDALDLQIRMKLKSVGNLNDRYVYSGDHNGIIRVYDLKRQALFFQFYATLERQAINHVCLVPHIMESLQRREYDEQGRLITLDGSKVNSFVNDIDSFSESEADSGSNSGSVDEVETESLSAGTDESDSDLESEGHPNSDSEKETNRVESNQNSSSEEDNENIDATDAHARKRHQKEANDEHILVFKMLVCDVKGSSNLFKIAINQNNEEIRDKKRLRREDERITDLYSSTKRKKQFRLNRPYSLGQFVEYHDKTIRHSFKDEVKIETKSGFHGIIGCVEASAASVNGKSLIFGGLGRRLFIFERSTLKWKLAHKVNVSQKIRALLAAF
eukprot:Gregarina_sp_Poly_1__1916@NODE_14_length_23033_cov_86_212880_g12_i0_p2_GENE_NODE_14_length_23033_cov_86_212880_g12_i0NODE_14_length_23033_cov_86_212880_g12_i0_p2_ORF_typecomplete_len579_score107_76CNH/PF00780_22/0_049CNH/PF00780_22/5_1e03DUF4520/PF15016_6/0_082SDA1/PF05285_12/0_22NESP55/PF06390_12/17NESP55/PF06390_12/4_6_NODE_14_length_23033_cov_86_212880_g12_i01461716353